MRLSARWPVALALGALALGGCRSQAPRPSVACAQGPRAILRALERAPARVALADGTRLSDCVADGVAVASTQQLGYVLTGASDALAQRARDDAGAALRLGYLAGAVRRGARQTNGAQSELARRLGSEATVTIIAPAVRAAYERGYAAGMRTG